VPPAGEPKSNEGRITGFLPALNASRER
jgi:hypothetical protein